jgi:hypothetical protein
MIIIPSSPMLTTPERSENIPPSAANTSGVAKRSIAASRADHTTTLSSFPRLETVARYAIVNPSTPAAMAKPPNRRSPRIATPVPSMTAMRARTRLGTHERSVTGGRASHAPTSPIAMPIQATRRKPAGMRATTGSATLVTRSPVF